jgi:hypothetical protein
VTVVLVKLQLNLTVQNRFFGKSSCTKFHKNSSNGSRVIACCERTGGQTDMVELTVVFHNYANAHNKTVLKKVINLRRGSFGRGKLLFASSGLSVLPSVCSSVRPSVHVYQLSSYWTNFVKFDFGQFY